MSTEPRPGARGPRPNEVLDRRTLEIRAALRSWGFAATCPQIASVLSVELDRYVSPDSVRGRLRRLDR